MEIGKEIKFIDPNELKPNPLNIAIYGEEEVDPELVASIDEQGQLDPLVITYDNVIISGHRRWLALKVLGKPAACLTITFNDDLEMNEALIEFNRQREKTWTQIYNEADLLEKIYAERAEQRRLANLKQNANKDTEEPNSASRSESGSTRDNLEKKTGVKRDRYSKIKKIMEKAKSGDEVATELVKKGNSGQITVDAASKILTISEIACSDSPVAEKAKVVLDQVVRGDITSNKGKQLIKEQKEQVEVQAVKTAKIPHGIFNIILSDTYPIADIAHKRITVDEDAVFFLWSSASSLPESLDLMKFWGYEYKSMIILDKGITGSGSLVLTSFDVLLIGIRGTGVLPACKLPGVIHEKKRDCIYELIEKMYPDQKYLELFKDNKRDEWNVGQVEVPQQKEPEPSQESNDTEQVLDKPFILYVGSRDMGVIDKFNNDEPNLAMQCHAIPKDLGFTELWDNKKNKLIFTFEKELFPDLIVRTAETEINKYLDKEEHLPQEPEKPEEAPQQKKETETSHESNGTENPPNKPFSLIIGTRDSLVIGTRDMGILEEFNIHESGIAMRCDAMYKEQVNTELWDNRKHELIFTFDDGWTPGAILSMSDQKIN
jgi:ParB-like chromosome segregation protein Spo0J/N6-adenosine-specific RNA methylase IME4